MAELGELERHQADFAQRNTRVVVASLEGRDEAEQTQKDFPDLVLVADTQRSLAEAAGMLHAHAGPNGRDALAPTTVLIDPRGIVRWLYRPDRVLRRLSPGEVLAAVDEHLAGAGSPSP